MAAALGLSSAPSPAAAQDDTPPVLHEFFDYTSIPSPNSTGALPLLPAPGRQETQPGDTPSPAAEDASLVLTSGGPIASASFADPALGGLLNGPATPEGDVTLDDTTEAEGMLRYQTVFEPSVVPWKRGSARNDVGRAAGQISIGVRPGPTTPVSIGGSAPDGFERFTGRLQLIARAGEPIPIPSVAPDMRIHAVSTVPPASATVLRDSADNYAITLDGDGAFDVTLQVSASRSYFGGPLPASGASPGPPRVDANIVAAAAPVIAAIGVPTGASELEIVRALTAWFRAFEPGTLPPPPPDTGLYQHVALTQLGVCRHRAQAFVITAAALGVVARYVHNEAHAFVEVRLTGFGWRRIDLGGAADGLEALGDAVTPHVPGEDGFDAADAESPYENRSAGTDDATANSDDTPTSGDVSDPAGATSDTPGSEGAQTEPGTHGSAPPGTNGAEPGTNGGAAPTAAAEPTGPRSVSVLALSVQAGRTYRGETVRVSGVLTDIDRVPLTDRPVRFLLEDDIEESIEIGVLETDEAGRFAGDIALPSTLEAGRWSLRARYDGDPTTGPAEAE